MKLTMLKPTLKTLGQKQRAPGAPGWLARQEGKTSGERGYGWAWQQARERVMVRDCGLCQCEECKRLSRVRVATEVDHIVPKFEGGTDDEANLQAINVECHKAKTAKESRRARGIA